MNSLKLKSWALAVGFAVTSISANAAFLITPDLNPAAGQENYQFSSVGAIGASFSDFIPLSFLGQRDLSGTASATSTGSVTFTTFDLVDAAQNVLTSGFVANAGARLTFAGLESSQGIGDYFVHLAGTSTGTATYNGNLALVSAVPEPETYAMMLAGLSLIGFAARRRKNG